ncbi:hypothetical protein [Nostoc piscinale]|uniref:hypothetical protein n=1 Tax=Nostoc piscinale TaxID=224012 RepID=UPI000AA32779|nr:hypothetical protein [Nostoc piscinale]
MPNPANIPSTIFSSPELIIDDKTVTFVDRKKERGEETKIIYTAPTQEFSLALRGAND